MYGIFNQTHNYLIQEQLRQPIKIGRIGTPLSHLLFAEDIIVLEKADITNAITIIQIFNKFAKKLGQVISFNKSSIVFWANISGEEKNRLSTTMNNIQKEKIGKYLGLTITNYHPKSSDY